MNSLQLFLGRSVAGVLRNFPWPIRSDVLEFPPITVKEQAKCLLVLGTPNSFLESLWSAYSWMRYLQEEVFLIIMVDGPITPGMKETYQRCFIGGRLEEASAFIGDIADGPSPFATYIRNSPFGRKLGATLKLNQDHSLLLSDNDIVVWDRPDEIIDAMRRDDLAVYNGSPGSPFDPEIVAAFQKRGLVVASDFNSGVLYLPQRRLDIALAMEVINETSQMHHFIEQGTIAGLSGRGLAKPLPESRYSLSTQGMWFWQPDIPSYEGLVCRHFVGPVRHWMYLQGYPRLRDIIRKDQAGNSSTSPR